MRTNKRVHWGGVPEYITRLDDRIRKERLDGCYYSSFTSYVVLDTDTLAQTFSGHCIERTMLMHSSSQDFDRTCRILSKEWEVSESSIRWAYTLVWARHHDFQDDDSEERWTARSRWCDPKVMEEMYGLSPSVACVAVLHDVGEDVRMSHIRSLAGAIHADVA